MKKVWITGADGHVGSALMQLLDCMEYQLLDTDINAVDITDYEQVIQYAHINRPDVIINCASLTDIEYCEKNVDDAYKVNALGARNLAIAANEIQAKLIHISTDDVFDQESNAPYNEFDKAHPKTIYGKSKEAAERIIPQHCNRFVIIRSSWTYGIGKDFVDEVLEAVGKVPSIEVPNNSYASPTSAKELAKVIAQFIDNGECGMYHVVCKGSCSRYEFAKAILECAGKSGQLELIPVLEKESMRPVYSVLDNMMLRLSNMEEPMEWKAALQEFINETGGVQ